MPRAAANSCGAIGHAIVHADHDGRSRDRSRTLQVMTGHLAGADERDAKYAIIASGTFERAGRRAASPTAADGATSPRDGAARLPVPGKCGQRVPIGIVYQNNGLSCAPH